MSGKGQFPFMVDPNTGKQMLESDAIISYLWNEYGNGQVLSSHVTKAIEALHANALVILIGDVTMQLSLKQLERLVKQWLGGQCSERHMSILCEHLPHWIARIIVAHLHFVHLFMGEHDLLCIH